MYLVEEFLTVQGEGKFLGELSVFIRFGKCNRTCNELGVDYENSLGQICYGCDTYDAVDVDFINNWKKVDFNDLVNILQKYSYCKNVVITGGEPLLNIKNLDFLKFIEHLENFNYKVTIETNGDIDIENDKIKIFEKVIFSISPKEEIKDKKYWYVNKESYVKALYGKKNITTNYLKELKNKGLNIYIMPIGENSSKIQEQRIHVFEYCLKNGFNYTTREHLFIFGSKARKESILSKTMINIKVD